MLREEGQPLEPCTRWARGVRSVRRGRPQPPSAEKVEADPCARRAGGGPQGLWAGDCWGWGPVGAAPACFCFPSEPGRDPTSQTGNGGEGVGFKAKGDKRKHKK